MPTRCWLMKCEPTAYTVDLEFVERFPAVVPLDTLKKTPGLEEMIVIKKWSRLSVQPVTRRGVRNCDPPREARVGLTYG
jgi:predicted RNA-binding protein with PUA-like domain